MRIMLVGSAGGHLAQLLRLQPWWQDHERLWVTFQLPDATSLLADEQVLWAHHPTTRSVRNLLRNAWLALREVPKFRPDVVVSSGAGVAVPFFLVARLFGAQTVYLEVFDRMDSATLTGRLCAPLTGVTLLQWRQQKKCYPNGVVVGPVL